jgi:hypothetical protein
VEIRDIFIDKNAKRHCILSLAFLQIFLDETNPCLSHQAEENFLDLKSEEGEHFIRDCESTYQRIEPMYYLYQISPAIDANNWAFVVIYIFKIANSVLNFVNI